MKGLPFCADMMLAWLDGRKTVTRRLINPQPQYLQVLRDGRIETSRDGGFVILKILGIKRFHKFKGRII